MDRNLIFMSLGDTLSLFVTSKLLEQRVHAVARDDPRLPSSCSKHYFIFLLLFFFNMIFAFFFSIMIKHIFFKLFSKYYFSCVT